MAGVYSKKDQQIEACTFAPESHLQNLQATNNTVNLVSKYKQTINTSAEEKETTKSTPSVSGIVCAKGMVRCEFCDAHFDAKCRAEHEAGRRHNENVAFTKRADCTVFVNGQWRKLFHGLRDVMEYFSIFGRVQVNIRSGLKLVYDEKECVDALMEEYQHSLKFEGVIIKRQQVGRNINKPRANNEENKAKVPTIPKFSGDFDAQLTSLISHIVLSKEETENLHRLTQDLETTLRLQWPGCSAIPFGSLVTGLGIKGSDVDCFIHLMHTDHKDDTQPNFVNKAKNLLQSRGRHLFKDVFAIPKAKTPIVKLVHIPTGASCDMNFQNCLGVMNSNLISYLLTIDGRIRPALLFLKYWSKVYNLQRKGLSNYALSMIFFFYLQQKPNVILPPVKMLQQDSQYDNVVKGWNCGFMYDKLHNSTNENEASIMHLLEGFFSFYADLDFTKYILSPYTGKLLPRDSLDVDENVQKIFFRYMNNLKQNNVKLRTDTAVCVQDPFEHAHNLLTGLAHRSTAELQSHFQGSAVICRRAIDTNYTNNLMHTLLTQKIKLSRAPKHTMKIKIKPRGAEEKQISERIAKVVDKMAKSVILDIFTKIFKCKLTAEHEGNRAQIKKKDEKNYIDNMEKKIERFGCMVTHDVWSQRDKHRATSDDSEVSTLTIEEAISNCLIRDVSRQCLPFNFNLTFNKDVNPQSPLIFIEPGENATDVYQMFIIFIQGVLHTLYYKIIGELSRPVSTMIFENKKKTIAGVSITQEHDKPTAENISQSNQSDFVHTDNSSEEIPKSASKHEMSPLSHSPPFKLQKNN